MFRRQRVILFRLMKIRQFLKCLLTFNHFLYLFSSHMFKTISLLKENGITHLLNVAEGPGLGSCGVFDKQPYEGKYLNESINTYMEQCSF